MSVQFRLLGEFQVLIGGEPAEIRRGQHRSVLTALLVDLNKPVPLDVLADRVWGDGLPKRPRPALHTYISLIRTALPGVSITQRSGGYLLSADPHSVDLHRFQDLIAGAQIVSDDVETAALLEQALALWTGEPLSGMDTPWLANLRETLTTQRYVAQLDLADAWLSLGEHAKVISRLDELVAPLDERRARQLMLAHYRAGHRQEALLQYERIRDSLAAELGVDPGPQLQELHQQILGGDKTPLPRQLLGGPRHFVGRTTELSRLTKAVDQDNSAVVISAIGGAGGVGKTWLALQWAYDHSDRFPDGQLFVNLRGFDPSGKPMPTHEAVRGFLHALGVAANDIPADVDEQAALYRSLVAGKRMLVVLDNAVDAAQVGPLLPGGRTCTVLITSRDRLAGLVTTHSALPLPLDVLDDVDARALLAARLGSERLAAEPEAVDELLAVCAGLPLALSIVAGRAQTYPDFPLSSLVDGLRPLLDNEPSLRAVLSWSASALTEEQSTVFGLLGHAPGPDISLAAATALTGLSRQRTAAVLRALERVSLVTQHVPGRYRMHDLTRVHAAEQAKDVEPALRRIVDFYLHTAYAGERSLNPHRARLELEPPSVEPLALADPLPWFDREHACLLATQRLAAAQGWHWTVIHLASTLVAYHTRRGHNGHDVETTQAALTASERLGEPLARMQALRMAGHALGRAGDPERGRELLYQALALSHRDEDAAYIHHTISQAWARDGNSREAREHARQALKLFEKLNLWVWGARAYNMIGWLSAQLGEFEEAQIACEAALALHSNARDLDGQAATIDSLGFIAHQMGRYDEALQRYEQALAIARELGHVDYEADFLTRLAETRLALGDRAEAVSLWRHSLAMLEDQQRTREAAHVRDQLSTVEGELR
ncbi:BTAD domain-containing putative transcriptional regulator [Actinocrispum sp. NPDC049592]|uniref:AfsR/SARP family transcriptional regulator n=1 Tax=Actinocrispum sp. NPDC049592 TaxID=3154835 RepID=UPI00344A5EE3